MNTLISNRGTKFPTRPNWNASPGALRGVLANSGTSEGAEKGWKLRARYGYSELDNPTPERDAHPSHLEHLRFESAEHAHKYAQSQMPMNPRIHSVAVIGGGGKEALIAKNPASRRTDAASDQKMGNSAATPYAKPTKEDSGSVYPAMDKFRRNGQMTLRYQTGAEKAVASEDEGLKAVQANYPGAVLDGQWLDYGEPQSKGKSKFVWGSQKAAQNADPATAIARIIQN